MGFSDKQLKALRRHLDHRRVRTRFANGRELSYIEGWYAISQANRIFGFDAWSRETIESHCVLTREIRGAYLAVYTAKVRITVEADGIKVIREGYGSGEGRASSPGEVHVPSKPPRPMPPSGHWQPSASRSDSSFIARINPLDRKAARSLRRSHLQDKSSAMDFIRMTPHRSRAHRTTMDGGSTVLPRISSQTPNQRKQTARQHHQPRLRILKTRKKIESTKANSQSPNPNDYGIRHI